MCSDDLDTALGRLCAYKRLCAPMTLRVDIEPTVTRLTVGWAEPTVEPPRLTYAMELCYVTKLARLGTRTHVVPRAVTSPFTLEPADATARSSGCRSHRRTT
jgi:hypothetical protein